MDEDFLSDLQRRMVQFIYQATDRDGQSLTGVVEAIDLPTAFCELEARGLTVLAIRRHDDNGASVEFASAEAVSRENSIADELSRSPVTTVWQRLVSERSDGITQGGFWCGELLEAFAGELSEQQTRRRWLAVAAACRANNVSAAENALPPEQRAWLLLLSDVAQTRRAAPLLNAALSFVEPLGYAASLRHVKRALPWVYPLVTLLASWMLFIFFSCTIAVEFEQWQESFGGMENSAALPARAYRFAMTLAALHREHIWAMIGIVGGLVLGVVAVGGWMTKGEWWWRIPVLSLGRRLDAYATTARTLSCLTRAEVPTEQLLPTAAELVSCSWFRGVHKTGGDRRFLNWLPQQIRAAADQATLTAKTRAVLWESLAVEYAEQRQRRTLLLSHVLEPACILASGMIVGLMMFILLTPLTLLTSNFMVLW